MKDTFFDARSPVEAKLGHKIHLHHRTRNIILETLYLTVLQCAARSYAVCSEFDNLRVEMLFLSDVMTCALYSQINFQSRAQEVPLGGRRCRFMHDVRIIARLFDVVNCILA